MGYRFGEIIIEPVSAFGTPLKGDTLFGQFCWVLSWCPQLLNGLLSSWLETYGNEPFVVFSSAFPSRGEYRYFPRPCFPVSRLLRELECVKKLERRKKVKAKRWVRVEGAFVVDLSQAKLLSGKEVAEEFLSQREEFSAGNFLDFLTEEERIRNAIRRSTFTTGQGGFSPYGLSDHWFLPGITLSIYVIYLEEAFTLAKVAEGLQVVGEVGFGRDASVGLGRFRVAGFKEHSLPPVSEAEAFVALSPFVPGEDDPEEVLFEPFVRFGRHGGPLAISHKPFKNPVLMADEGALIKGKLKKPFVGRALRGLSEVMPETVSQGYAPIIPVVGENL